MTARTAKSIVQVGNEHLRDRCKKVDADNIGSKELLVLYQDLRQTLNAIGGVGLAAPQIGAQWQVFLVNIGPTKFRPTLPKIEPYIVINPEIMKEDDTQTEEYEGCFSVAEAGIFFRVKRPKTITVAYTTEQGERIQRDLYDFEARVFLHEYDHLHGKLFLDTFVDLASAMSANEYRRMQKAQLV